MVQDTLRRHRGKITAAALELGISRPTIYEVAAPEHVHPTAAREWWERESGRIAFCRFMHLGLRADGKVGDWQGSVMGVP